MNAPATFPDFADFQLKRGCTGKQRFPNANMAWKAAKRMSRRNRRAAGETPLQAYWCAAGCGGWHVGHKDRPKR